MAKGMNRISILSLTLALAALLFLTACSKDGGARNLLEGREVPTDPVPTDGNMPGPDQ